MAEIATRHDLLVISDEIHADLTYEPHRHVSFAAFAPERTVTLQSAGKAFNLAGLRCCVAHIGDARVRAALDTLPPLLMGQPGNLGVLGTLAAWQHGDAWLADVRAVLHRNRRTVADGLPAGVGFHLPEATYLAWLDFRPLGLRPDPAARILDRAGLMLSPGHDCGPGGEGFARLNFATGRTVLDDILDRLRAGCSDTDAHAGTTR
jgi:cystathionine beta-lyase